MRSKFYLYHPEVTLIQEPTWITLLLCNVDVHKSCLQLGEYVGTWFQAVRHVPREERVSLTIESRIFALLNNANRPECCS